MKCPLVIYFFFFSLFSVTTPFFPSVTTLAREVCQDYALVHTVLILLNIISCIFVFTQVYEVCWDVVDTKSALRL